MEASPEPRAWTAPQDREAPTGPCATARRGGRPYRLTRLRRVVDVHKKVHTNVHTPGQQCLLTIQQRTGQSGQGRLCRGARHVGRRTLTARELNRWTQWTQDGRNRPAWMRLVHHRGGRRRPRSVPTVRRGGFAPRWYKCVALFSSPFAERFKHAEGWNSDGFGTRRIRVDPRISRMTPLGRRCPAGRQIRHMARRDSSGAISRGAELPPAEGASEALVGSRRRPRKSLSLQRQKGRPVGDCDAHPYSRHHGGVCDDGPSDLPRIAAFARTNANDRRVAWLNQFRQPS